MAELQDFTGTDCARLIPQGDVLLEQRFVRVTLLGKTLDDKLIQWDRDDATIYRPIKGTATIGIPMWQLDADMGAAATRPFKIKLDRDNEIFLGADMVYLPGLNKAPRPAARIVTIPEQAMGAKDPIKLWGDATLPISAQRTLLRSGEVRVRSESEGEFIVRIRRSAKRIGAPLAKPAATSSSLVFSTSSTRTIHQFNFLLQEAFGSIEVALKAFLADPRAGRWHNPSLDQVDLITQFDNDTFNAYFELLQTVPEWNRLTRIAPQPELPSFPIAAVTVFRQTHELLGFSRGRLLESVTLGPEETVSIEVFTWDRAFEEREETFSTEVEQSVERQRRQSVTVDIATDMQNSVGVGVGGELGLSLPVEAVNVDGGISGDVRTEMTTRNQTTTQMLTEATTSAAEKFKATHQVKTLTRRETGVEERVTRTFKNPNLGRILHLHHFEVLGHYRVKTIVDETPRMALLVENPPLGSFDRDWVRAHHHFLDEILLHDAYRTGLEAAQLLAAQEWIDEMAAAEKRAKEAEEQRRAAQLAAGGASTLNFLPNKGIFATARRLKETLDKFLNLDGLDGAMQTLGDHLNPFTNVAKFDLMEAERLIARSAWWTQFNLAYGGMEEQAQEFSNKMQNALSRFDEPESADDVVAAVGGFVERLDDDWLIALKSFGAGYLIALLFLPAALLNPLVYAYIMKLLYLPDDIGLMKLISSARADYAQHKAKQSAETLTPPAPAPGEIEATDLVQPPPRAFAQRELAEAHTALDRLILHLQAHEAYYTNTFYRREDPELRMNRLRQIGVAEYIENRVLGFAGTAAIFPLRFESLPAEVRTQLTALTAAPTNTSSTSTTTAPAPDPATHDITLPTGGLVTEAVLGECEALEPYLTTRRAHDLQERHLRNLLLELEVEHRQQELTPVDG